MTTLKMLLLYAMVMHVIIRVCVCMCVCIRAYVCMYVCMHACVHTCVYVHVHVCIYMYIYTCNSSWEKKTISISSENPIRVIFGETAFLPYTMIIIYILVIYM